MYQPLIKFHPYPAIITQVLCIFAPNMYFSCRENDIFVQQCPFVFPYFYKDLRITLFALSTADVSNEAK